MSIYPDRAKDGALTGNFRVDLVINGQRKRGRAPSLAEAKALEVSFVRELTTGVSAPVVRLVRQEGVTLGNVSI